MMDEREERRKDAMARTSFRHVPDVDSTVATFCDLAVRIRNLAGQPNSPKRVEELYAVAADVNAEMEHLRAEIANQRDLLMTVKDAVFEKNGVLLT